jgi:DNA-binding PadR family transcriptional regulator
MAVLGLLMAEPATPSRLAQRLADDLPAARFARSSVNNALKRLKSEGHVHVVDPVGECYEILPSGIERFRTWVRLSSSAPPPQREPLHGKVSLSQPEDLEGLIQSARKEERACTREYAALHSKIAAANLTSFIDHGLDGGVAAWVSSAKKVVMVDEAVMWNLRSKRLARLRRSLEGLREQARRYLSDGDQDEGSE